MNEKKLQDQINMINNKIGGKNNNKAVPKNKENFENNDCEPPLYQKHENILDNQNIEPPLYQKFEERMNKIKDKSSSDIRESERSDRGIPKAPNNNRPGSSRGRQGNSNVNTGANNTSNNFHLSRNET